MFRMYWNNLRQQPRFSQVYSRFSGRPAWVWGIAFLVGMLPFLVFIALLFLAALLVTGVIYLLLSAVHEVVSRLTGSTDAASHDPLDENFQGGRENVRVISPNHSE